MRNSIKDTLIDKEVLPEQTDLAAWEKHAQKESPQTIRNVGRIEQLEAKQVDLERLYKILISQHSKSSKWANKKLQLPTVHLPWQDVVDVDTVYTLFDLEKSISIWEQAQFAIQPIGPHTDQIEPYYDEKLSILTKLFAELEQDFEDIGRRIVRCTLLEEELGRLEDYLEDDEAECLCWCVSLVRDILDYNYPEDLSKSHIILFKKAIDLIYKKNINCNKQDYQDLHKTFLESGLALLPTSRKAIEKYQ